MKLNKLSKTTMSLAAAMGAIAMTTSANAATPILSVDFNDTDAGPGNQAGFTAWDEFTGWSKINVGGSGLDVTITGAGTGLGAGIYTRGNAVDGVGPGFTYAALYNDWLYGQNGDVDFSISGLVPNTAYEITWYSYDGDTAGDATTTFKATDGSLTTTGDTLVTPTIALSGDPTANDDNAYTGTWTSTTGTLELTAGSDGSGARVNGFVISVVPEPTTTALLGLGGLALILRRRK